MINKKSILVAILVENEEPNIAHLLQSVLNQKGNNFIFDNIIVICEGHLDNTAKIVSQFADELQLIKLINDGKKLGKAARLNTLFAQLRSDILITLHSDIVLDNQHVIASLVKAFHNKHVGLVSGYDLPAKQTTFFEKILEIYELVRRTQIYLVNKGNNIHHTGRISAVSLEFSKNIKIPEDIVDYSNFLYMKAIEKGLKFRLAKKAVVYFRFPMLGEYLKNKSLFEIINSLTLDFIWNFYKITKLPIIDKSKKIILCYHSVGTDGWRFSTRPKVFKDHIKNLKKESDILPLTKLLTSRKGGIAITFDDGYKNVIENALPILEEEKAVATLFAIGNPEIARRDELKNNLPIMTDEEIKSLHAKGWEIGYHTSTHPNLDELTNTELYREIDESKTLFEQRLGIKLQYFAYPRGIYSTRVVECTRKAGFKAAFTVNSTDTVIKNKDKMLLDRVPVEGELSSTQLLALISPIGLKITKFYMKVLTFKEKHLHIPRIKLATRLKKSYSTE